MKKAPVAYSEILKDFLDFFESVRTTYNFNMESMKEELAPIVDFFEDRKNRSVLNNMKHLLGQVRKMEGAHQRRLYTPKVMDLHKVLEDRTGIRIENAENEKPTPLVVEI